MAASLLRLFTGTSQGATPVQDGGTRALIFLVANAITQYLLDYFSATTDFRSLVATIGNPLLLLAFSFADKIDQAFLRDKGIEPAPTTTSAFDTPHD